MTAIPPLGAFAMFVLGVLLGFISGRFRASRFNLGEALVANTIARGFQRPHILLNNVTLEWGGQTTQIDHILVVDTGIFVVETKHYSGWIFGDPDQKQWTQVIYKKKSRFLNPLVQNLGHARALQSLFKLPATVFHSLVVFTGDAEFKTDLGPLVLKRSGLIAELSRERPVIFDEAKMAYVAGRIEMKRLRRSLETDEYHLNLTRQRLESAKWRT